MAAVQQSESTSRMCAVERFDAAGCKCQARKVRWGILQVKLFAGFDISSIKVTNSN